MNNWNLKKLEELLSIKPRNGLYKGKEFQGTGHRWVKMNQVYSTDFFTFQETEYIEVSESEVERFCCEKGDLLFGRTSLTLEGIGDCMLIEEVSDVPIFESNLFRLRFNTLVAYPLFYFYFFKSFQGKNIIQSIAKQTAATSITSSDLIEQYVPTPPLEDQIKIASILKRIDDKIELNRQMNQTLEDMAQALFKSWFVDFDPVLDNAILAGNEIPKSLKAKKEKRLKVQEKQGLKVDERFPDSFVYNEELGKWIPEGWEVNRLEILVDVKYGKDHKKLKDGDFPCYGSGGVMRYVQSMLCETESVLIPRKGSLNNLMYVRNPFWSVDTMFYTEMKLDNFVKYFYYFMKQFDLAEMNVGSAVPSMTTKLLNSISILKPSSKTLELFENEIELIFQRMEKAIVQTETLTKIRDILLPQLIGGKLRVPESSDH